MNSTYVPLTVHDYPRRTNLYVNFAQTVNHDHIIPANFNVPKKVCVSGPFWLFTCVLLSTPHSPIIMGSHLDLNHVRHMSKQCVYTVDWLHAHAKYSPDALPVKQITFRAQA